MRIETEEGIGIDNVVPKSSYSGKMRGLMFKEKGRVLLRFSQMDKHSIWMLGMRFPIDIAFIDDEQTIVDVRQEVQPMSFDPRTWRIYRPNRMCQDILEVEAGLLNEKEVTVGDQLRYRDNQAQGSNS